MKERTPFVVHRGSCRGSLEDFNGMAPLPEEPVNAEPGTEDKLAVMAERAARGERLFHPADARRPVK